MEARGIAFSEAGVRVSSAVSPIRNCEGCRSVSAVGDEGVEITSAESGVEETPGERKVRRMIDPLMPSLTEVQEHQLTHLPFRSWCPPLREGASEGNAPQ